MRKLTIVFWVFIIVMLLWQFYTYDQGLTQAAKEHPQQEHFYFFHTNAPPVAPVQPTANGPDVEQTAYSVEEHNPTSVSMTCHITLKNLGNAKAVNVQAEVRPYRGTRTDDEDVGANTQTTAHLDDNDYRSQISEWLSFPDLAPGQSSTQSVVFLSRTDLKPGTNPNPKINFQPEKAKP
jgi:hypothetical protein